MEFPAHFQAQPPTSLSDNILSSFCWRVPKNTHSQGTVRVIKVLLTDSSPSSQNSLLILQSCLFLFILFLTQLISLCVKSEISLNCSFWPDLHLLCFAPAVVTKEMKKKEDKNWTRFSLSTLNHVVVFFL